MEYSKIYILIKEDIDIGHALLACAHGSLMCYLKFKDTPEFKEYLDNSFRKCVCSLNISEFENAKKYDDYVIVTESALGNAETALVFKPRVEWPKAFKYYRLWKGDFVPDKSKYVKFDTNKLGVDKNIPILKPELLSYSFDDMNIGIISESRSTIKDKLIERPIGIATNDWYKFAGKICNLLNKQNRI